MSPAHPPMRILSIRSNHLFINTARNQETKCFTFVQSIVCIRVIQLRQEPEPAMNSNDICEVWAEDYGILTDPVSGFCLKW